MRLQRFQFQFTYRSLKLQGIELPAATLRIIMRKIIKQHPRENEKSVVNGQSQPLARIAHRYDIIDNKKS